MPLTNSRALNIERVGQDKSYLQCAKREIDSHERTTHMNETVICTFVEQLKHGYLLYLLYANCRPQTS